MEYIKRLIYVVVLLLIIIPNTVCSEVLDVSGNSIAIRNAPTTVSSTVLGRVSSGTSLTLKSTSIFSDQGKNGTCDKGWYNVTYQGQNAYICATYGIIKTSSIVVSAEAKTECEAELKEAGFPDSYWDGLCKIKTIHPTWKFNAVQTGYNFSDVVNEEAKCKKNTLVTKNPEYIDNTCTSKIDSGYEHASQKAVAYYMNPLNFLDEVNIFMFESNYQNKGITEEINNQIINNRLSSYVSSLPSLPSAINNACNEKDVSQSFIVARIRQELGATGLATKDQYKGKLLSCISGEYSTRWNRYAPNTNASLDYYYNFFNIGVYDGSNEDAAYVAVVEAYNRGWGGTGDQATDISKAIAGGAEVMKKAYIDNAQHTIYFQKFNVAPVNKNAIFSHQYMTNLAAPVSESSSIYTSYKKANILENAFVFYIPIYNNLNADIENSPDGATGEKENNTSNGLSVPSIITSTGYKITGKSISGIAPGTTLEDMKNKLNATGGTIVSSTTDVIGTGTVLTISNGTVQEQYTIVIKGDTSGDGKINALDLLQIQKSILGQVNLNEYTKISADVSGDGNVSALDLLQIQKSILGQSVIAQ